ncbi:hypothetical protein SAMD00019534_023510, partial [Acytostelium subglobosum LB1]|uniref:hypothetical protein n=1 Tax=Acytostelium subglobosum LB1 TaxID=1410327 RepID=UPI000644B636
MMDTLPTVVVNGNDNDTDNGNINGNCNTMINGNIDYDPVIVLKDYDDDDHHSFNNTTPMTTPNKSMEKQNNNNNNKNNIKVEQNGKSTPNNGNVDLRRVLRRNKTNPLTQLPDATPSPSLSKVFKSLESDVRQASFRNIDNNGAVNNNGVSSIKGSGISTRSSSSNSSKNKTISNGKNKNNSIKKGDNTLATPPTTTKKVATPPGPPPPILPPQRNTIHHNNNNTYTNYTNNTNNNNIYIDTNMGDNNNKDDDDDHNAMSDEQYYEEAKAEVPRYKGEFNPTVHTSYDSEIFEQLFDPFVLSPKTVDKYINSARQCFKRIQSTLESMGIAVTINVDHITDDVYLGILRDYNYSVDDALKSIDYSTFTTTTPCLHDHIQATWTTKEKAEFQYYYKIYQRPNLPKIQSLLGTKTLQETIEYFFYWKGTKSYKRLRKQVKLNRLRDEEDEEEVNKGVYKMTFDTDKPPVPYHVESIIIPIDPGENEEQLRIKYLRKRP